MNRKLLSYLSAALLVLLIAGCAPRARTVNVTLTDFGVRSSQTTFEAGMPYRFVFTNEGLVEHEIMIMPPMDPEVAAEMDMHDLDEMALLVVHEHDLEPDASHTFEFTFPESARGADLEFACHTEQHYMEGMKLPIAVE